MGIAIDWRCAASEELSPRKTSEVVSVTSFFGYRHRTGRMPLVFTREPEKMLSSGECDSDGGFTMANLTWPLSRGHILDPGLAKIIAHYTDGQSLLDVGAGSGVYGAYFARLKPGDRAPSLYHGVDGTKDIDKWLRLVNAPLGANVSYANICQRGVQLPSADWAISLE
ncbi:MAG: hypothetical protein SGPRY_012824, partial [Prymnesium sp.]